MEQTQGPVHYLPSIHHKSVSGRSPREPAPPPFGLPHLTSRSAATKAERYSSLREFDRNGLQRSKAHVRNALKTTNDLDRISRQLNERLKSLKGDQKKTVSFDRLSEYRDAFEEIVKTSGAFSPLLNEIQNIYNQYLMTAVSQQQEYEPTRSITQDLSLSTPDEKGTSKDLLQLKKQLHHLEVESRVLLQDNNRLREELSKEKEHHTHRKHQEMARIDSLKNHPVSPYTSSTHVQDYATQVESLQLKIAEERQAIATTIYHRKGKIPLSVCHNLEQCLREAEIETQKYQRHSEHLLQEIEKWKGALWEQLQIQGFAENFRGIWDKIITK
ncbi:uncharacterized protein LOC135341638 [Halichondria panicea]|uniref:uncharacterized protein LOC135341638 n=1 Tax=Halichondria panicea TaxID=6063 RepID=UPI00312B5685